MLDTGTIEITISITNNFIDFFYIQNLTVSSLFNQ